MKKLFIITGPSGVGKTTLSYKLAETLSNAVVVNADDIYHEENVENIAPWEVGSEKITQRMWNRCFVEIRENLNKDNTVIFNYLINRKELETIITKFSDCECHFVCLIADETELIKRDDVQPGEIQYDRIKVHIEELNKQKFGKYVLDTTHLSIDEEIHNVLSGKFVITNACAKLSDINTEL